MFNVNSQMHTVARLNNKILKMFPLQIIYDIYSMIRLYLTTEKVAQYFYWSNCWFKVVFGQNYKV